MTNQRTTVKNKATQLTKLLKEKEISLKHTQALEITAKLLFNKPWHSFKKETEDDILFKERTPDVKNLLVSSNSYFNHLKKGSLKNKFIFGVDLDTEKFYVASQIKNANTLITGAPGTGKSNALKFILLSHLANNSEDTVYCLIDPVSGMTELNELYRNKRYSKNIINCIDELDGDNISKVLNLIDYLYKELMARQNIFYKEGVVDYLEYERKTKEKLTKFMVVIENFYTLPNNKDIKFHMKCDQEDSSAYKLKKIFRAGRKMGIHFVISTNRATSADLPSAIGTSISNRFTFRLNNPGEASAINLSHANDISADETGKAAYEDGFLQVPLIDAESMTNILTQYYKPLVSKTIIELPKI